MGPSSSAGSFTTALTSQYMSQYGGIVQVDSQQGVVYQIWEDCGPEFDVLIAKRLRLKHKNLVTVEAIEKL